MNTERVIAVPVTITARQERDILRFRDTCEDGQGYDVPKDRMKSLALLGLVRSVGFSRYEITDAGDAVIEKLRALLDAPASVESLIGRTGGGMVWHECAVCHVKGSYHPDVKWCVCGRPFELPAAQPQGEPVADLIRVDRSYRNGLMAGFQFGIIGDEKGYAACIQRYNAGIQEAKAEQPAPGADPKCERCKGWGFRDDPETGIDAGCGTCNGTGKEPTE